MIKIRSKISRVSTAIVIVVIALIFYIFSFRPAGELSWHQKLIVGIIAPMQRGIACIGDTIVDTWNHYFYLVGLGRENDRLKRLVDEQNVRLALLEEISLENVRLRSLLDISGRHGLDVVGAKIIANDPRGDFRVMTIDRGKKDGIRANMAVMSAVGLVGRVVEVAGRVSRVLLITDPNNVVDIVDQRSRARALLAGTVAGTAMERGFYFSRLEYLDRKSDVAEGDVVVTSGLDGMYPPGIPIGSISEVEHSPSGVFREANVVPFTDFSSLEEVLIIKKK